MPLGNVTAAVRPHGRCRHLPAGFRQTIFDLHKDQTIVPPETFRAAYRLQKKKREQIALGKRAAPRTKTCVTAAIVTVKLKVFLEPNLVGGVLYHVTPRNYKTTKGEEPINAILQLRDEQANREDDYLSSIDAGTATHL